MGGSGVGGNRTLVLPKPSKDSFTGLVNFSKLTKFTVPLF